VAEIISGSLMASKMASAEPPSSVSHTDGGGAAP